MKKFLTTVILFFLFLNIGIENLCFAQTVTPDQVQRSQEILEKERDLRERLEKEEKIYIKEIEVEGISLLDPNQIEEIISPFQRHWLTKTNIEQLLELIRQAYQQKGHKDQPHKISYKIQKKHLIIEVQELPSKE